MLDAPLHSRLRAHSASTAARVRRTLADRFGPDAGAGPAERAHVRDTIAHAVVLSVELVRRNTPLPPDFVEACCQIAAAAARHRRPPSDVAAFPELVAMCIQTAYWELAGPGDHGELAGFSVRTGELVSQLRGEMHRTYFEQLRRDGFSLGAGTDVAALLVSGQATEEVLWAAGHPPAEHYQIVVVRADVDTDADEVVGDAAARVPGVLICTTGDDTVVIEPLRDAGSARPAAQVPTLLRDDPRLAHSGMAVDVVRGIDALPDAVSRARELVGLVLRVGRTGRLNTHQDLFLESHLLADPRAVRQLRGVVAALAHEPELVRTLQTLYLNDLDRTRTARDLGIARRTLAYRTQRIEELTGMHPTGARAVQVLGIGLSALRVRSG